MILETSSAIYEVADRVATITMNRPDRLNAFTPAMMREMLDAFDAADRDDEVRALIITGSGRAFCAGADLSGGSDAFDYGDGGCGDGTEPALVEHGVHRDTGGLITLRLFQMNKPVIAAINGAAAGFGATFPLACDMRLASSSARFFYPFVRRGIVPESCSSWFLPRIVGLPTALDWSLSGRAISADEAFSSGLVRSLHAPETLLAEARAIAMEIATNTAAQAVALTRQMIWRMMGASHPMEAHRVDSRGVEALGKASDTYEGVAAFLEKRRPRFSATTTHAMPDIFPDWEEPSFR